MTIFNAGIGALDMGDSEINPATRLTTDSTFFDPVYCDRALITRDDLTDALLYHTPYNTSRIATIQWAKTMIYIPAASGDFPQFQMVEVGGRSISLAGDGSFIRFTWRPRSVGVTSFATEGVDFPTLPRDELFEFAMVMETGEFARFYVNGNLWFESSGTAYDDVFTFGGTSSSRQAIFISQARAGNIYFSEMMVADEDIRGVRVRDIAMSRIGGSEATVGDPPEILRYPGATNSPSIYQDADFSNFSMTLAGTGPTGSPNILGLFVAMAESGTEANPMQIRLFDQSASSSTSIVGPGPWRESVNPADGEQLGVLIDQYPFLGGTPWTEADVTDTYIGPHKLGSTPTSVSVYSFQPVLLYGGDPPIDPRDGALATQVISYTVQEDQDALADLFGLKASQAVSYTVHKDLTFLGRLEGAAASQAISYTVFRNEVEPVASQVISYTVVTLADEPRMSQGIAYTVFRDDDYLARQLGTAMSQGISYTVQGPPGTVDASQAISYVVARLGNEPRATQAISYTVLGAGDPAIAFQAVSYTVMAAPPPAPYISTIIIGRSRY